MSRRRCKNGRLAMFVLTISVFIGRSGCRWAGAACFIEYRASSVASVSEANLGGYSQGFSLNKKYSSLNETNGRRLLRER